MAFEAEFLDLMASAGIQIVDADMSSKSKEFDDSLGIQRDATLSSEEQVALSCPKEVRPSKRAREHGTTEP